MRANLHLVYPDRRIEGAWLFRLTRAAELDLADEDAGNLLQAIEESVGRRALNAIVRVEVERAMPQPLRERLLWELRFERGRGRRRGAGAGPGRGRRACSTCAAFAS